MTPKRKRSNVHCRCVGDTDGKKLRTYAREMAHNCAALLLSSWNSSSEFKLSDGVVGTQTEHGHDCT